MREDSFTSYVTWKVKYVKIIKTALSISLWKISSFQNCVFCWSTTQKYMGSNAKCHHLFDISSL